MSETSAIDGIQGVLRSSIDRLPRPMRRLARYAGRRLNGREPRGRPIRFGSFGRLRPVNADWGLSRGTPVDRHYIEGFVHRHRHLVAGHVLEVQNDGYARGFGHDIRAVDVVDIDASNPAATIIADLGEPDSLPPGRFDCAIVVQTLQFVDDLDAAIGNLWRSLAPGGTLMVTMPTVSKLEDSLRDVEAWRVTPRGMELLLRRNCREASIHVEGFGNVLVSTSFLQGLAASDLTADELAHYDPIFPTGVCAWARRPG